jgi:hypothetical protein
MIWLTILGCILLVLLILCAVVFAIAVTAMNRGCELHSPGARSCFNRARRAAGLERFR